MILADRSSVASPFLELLEPRLMLTGTITGVVMNQDGAIPLGEIDIMVFQGENASDGGPDAWEMVTSVQADLDGRFTIPDLEARQYHLEVYGGQQFGGLHYLGQDLFNIAVTDDQTTDAGTFNLRQAGFIYGYVYDPLGFPIANATVVADGAYTADGEESYNAQTDATGRYELYVAETDQEFYPVKVYSAWRPGETYRVYGSNAADALTKNLAGDLTAQGFTLLGWSIDTHTFAGSYKTFVIRTESGYVAGIDAIQTPAGYYTGGSVSTNMWQTSQLTGAPDGSWAAMGDNGGWLNPDPVYFAFTSATAQASITVHVVDQGVTENPMYFGAQIAPGLYAAELAGTEGPDFTLAIGGVIRGRAVTSTGTSMIGVTPVDAVIPTANGTLWQGSSPVGSSGYYVIPSVPQNVPVYLNVDCDLSGYTAGGSTYAAGDRFIGPVTIAGGAVVDAPTLTVQKAVTFGGTVRNALGQPIPGAIVFATGFDQDGGILGDEFGGMADGSGQFGGLAPAGTYWLVCLAEGYLPWRSAAMVTGTPGGTILQNITMTASGGFTVTGSVTNFAAVAPQNGAGQTLPYSLIEDYDDYGISEALEVYAFDLSTPWTYDDFLLPLRRGVASTDVFDGFGDYFAPTGDAGTFAIALPAGERTIVLTRYDATSLGTGTTLFSDVLTVNGASGQVLAGRTLALTTGTSSFNGTVSFGAGKSVPTYAGATSIVAVDVATGMPRAMGEVAPDGRFIIEDLPAGTYVLRAAAKDLPLWTSVPLTLAADQALVYDIAFGGAPTIASLAVSKAVPLPGEVITLTANATAPGTAVSQVVFYLDADGDGHLTPADTLIGQDNLAAGGYTYNYTVPGGASGTLRFFALAVDTTGNTSDPATATVRVNARPTIGSATSAGPAPRGASVLLTAGAVLDGDGTIAKVEFFRDLNANGVIDAEDKLIGTGVKKYGTNDWTYAAATTGYGVTPAYNAGDNVFIARATDNNGGTETRPGVITLTNKAPTVASLTSNLAVLNPGGPVTLKANTVADGDGTIARVEFFVDTNANGVFNAGIDAKIGEDLSAQYGAYSYDYTVPADAVPGTMRFFAQAVDNDGGTSALPAPTVTGRVNANPTIGGVTTNGPLPRGSNVLLTASAVTDDGTVSKVEFFRDLDGNGTIDAGDKLIGTGVKKYGTNDWTYAASTTGYYANPAYTMGDNFFIARATDNNGGVTIAQGTITLTNKAPTVASLTSNMPVLNPGGQVVLKANTVADGDGTIARVEFFVDTNANGTYNAGIDAKIGEDLSAQYGAYSLDYRVPADAVPGTLRFFAVAVDNDGGTSNGAATVTGRINAPPVIGGVTTNGPLPRGSSILLTAGAVTDDATVSKVEFFRDLNGDGTIDAGDKLIGTGTKKYGTNDWTYSASTTGYYANPAYTMGDNFFIARATDNNGGVTTAQGTITLTNQSPTVASLTSNLAVLNPGGLVTLKANTVADKDGTIARVEFFVDTNANGTYNAGIDAKIGEDLSAQYGAYSLDYRVPADAVPGTLRFFAVAVDNDGGTSNGAATVTGRINAPPTIGGVTTNGPLPRGSSVLLTAGAVTDDATVSKVEFYRDIDGDGVIDAEDKLLGMGMKKYGTNDWTYSAATTGYYANPAYIAGVNHFIAKATDNNGGVTTAAGSVTLTNKPPTIGSLGLTPTTVARSGQVTLTASTVADTDGTVAKVEYFIDSNANAAYDFGVDAKIGEMAAGQYGSYVYKYTIPNDAAPGAVRFFAVATDSDGAVSAARMSAAATVLPEVSVAATVPAATEGVLAAGTFRITRSAAAPAALTVNFTLTGTAAKGTDYTTAPTTLSAVIPANQTWVDVTIAPTNDALVEAAETVILTLSTSTAYSLAPLAKTATVTIADNDLGGLVVTALPGLTTSEAGKTATFQVRLSAPPTANVTIPIASDDPSEGTTTVGMLTFTPYNWNTNQTVTVRGANDGLPDGDVAYNIIIGLSVSVLEGYNGLVAPAVALTNLDND